MLFLTLYLGDWVPKQLLLVWKIAQLGTLFFMLWLGYEWKILMDLMWMLKETFRSGHFIVVHNDTSSTYIDGCRSVDRIICSLVTPVNRQRQSDSYWWRLFRCCDDIVKMEEKSDNNILLNRMHCLNNTIPKSMTDGSYLSFKLKCKEMFLKI